MSKAKTVAQLSARAERKAVQREHKLAGKIVTIERRNRRRDIERFSGRF